MKPFEAYDIGRHIGEMEEEVRKLRAKADRIEKDIERWECTRVHMSVMETITEQLPMKYKVNSDQTIYKGFAFNDHGVDKVIIIRETGVSTWHAEGWSDSLLEAAQEDHELRNSAPKKE